MDAVGSETVRSPVDTLPDSVGDANVHFAITRTVKPGQEAAFESAVLSFIERSAGFEGGCGAFLLRPSSDGNPREYGILRSFSSVGAMHRFYESELFADWQRQVAAYVDGDPIYRQLHGLEAFFRGAGPVKPPRWKMAVVTWLGVYPVVFFWLQSLGPLLRSFHAALFTGVVTAVSVATLTWLVMPGLTKLFSGWLQGARS